MPTPNRRQVFALLGGSLGVIGVPLLARPVDRKTNQPRIVIVGSGAGGAATARALTGLVPGASVTVVDAEQTIAACYRGNDFLAGLASFNDISFSREHCKTGRARQVTARVESINVDAKTLVIRGGVVMPWDILVLAGGVSMQTDSIEGYTADTPDVLPHAWSGGDQLALLRQQLVGMEDGGTFLVASPPGRYRCPPAVYERVSLVANYFQRIKPNSKIVVLDGKSGFINQAVIEDAWQQLPGYD